MTSAIGAAAMMYFSGTMPPPVTVRLPVPDMIAYYIRSNMAIFRSKRAQLEELDNAIHTYGDGPANGQLFRNPDLGHAFRVLDMSGTTQLYRPRLLSPLWGAI